MQYPSRERGASLIDVVVGASLMLLVFMGIAAAFKLSVDAVGNNKARAGAIALAVERIEYVRSLTYGAVGTVGGIPSGSIQQSESLQINGVPYVRRTIVLYADDPGDGLAENDSNDIVADYKAVKVSVSWMSRTATRTIEMITRVSPVGIETAVPGGTLALRVVDAAGDPVQNAEVEIVNTALSPAIELLLFTDEDGGAQVIGAPAGSGYEIVVSKPGLSSAQTYGVTAQNTNPIPGHIAVADSQTTSATFVIDTLSELVIETYEPPQNELWSDSFDDSSKVEQTTSAAIAGGVARLPGSAGEYAPEALVHSIPIQNAYIDVWGEVSWGETRPLGTDIVYRVYDTDLDLIPEEDLPGNASGFRDPIDLSALSTSTYPTLVLSAELTTESANVTPEISSWGITYTTRPMPLPNVDLALEGAKIIGGNSSGSLVHKYDAEHSSGVSGRLVLTEMEFDNYTVRIDTAENLDIASACLPQPIEVLPGVPARVVLELVPHTAHSLLVDVRASNGTPLPQAHVRLTRGATSQERDTNDCGNAHIANLSQGTVGGGNPYAIEVTASGYGAYTSSEVSISGTTQLSVILTES